MQPIFIFSLPRAGSTLLQRILMTNDKISSTNEPWILLPLLYQNKKFGTVSIYSHASSNQAINEFINTFPGKKNQYNEKLREFILKLYEAVSNENSIYFLDKTPRYHLIIDEIEELFPNAKFIFLFRNPIQVYASMLTTFCKNSFKNIFEFNIDLTDGIKNLSNGYLKLKDKSIAIQYENLVQNPEQTISDINKYLDLQSDYQNDFNLDAEGLEGSFGDPKRFKRKKITNESIIGWKQTFNSKIRKQILLKYVNSLEDKYLLIQGYKKSEIVSEIKSSIKTNRFGSLRDVLNLQYGYLVRRYKLFLFFGKIKSELMTKHLS